MKLIKKSVSILLSSMMIMGCTVTALTANASTVGQLSSKYATNPNGKTGISKTITIDGGRVLDVPLILALSVDRSSTSMSNKNTNGGSIWGQKMGIEFKQHVDHLFYMSGKPGLGSPAMFTAVDDEGNTNYTTGCQLYKVGRH